MAGDEIVQIYIGYQRFPSRPPGQGFEAFTRVTLQARRDKTVSFEVKASDLAYYNPKRKPGRGKKLILLYAGPSSRAEDLLKSHFQNLGRIGISQPFSVSTIFYFVVASALKIISNRLSRVSFLPSAMYISVRLLFSQVVFKSPAYYFRN